MERKILEKDLNKIYKSLSTMTSLVIENIDEAIIALHDYDNELAEKVIGRDEPINAMEIKIEQNCVIFIARNQPVASDLRIIQSIYKISSDLERIGDQAKDISRLIIDIDGKVLDETHLKVLKMANETKEMVVDSIQSFLNRNIELAYDIVERDDIIDKYYYELKAEIFNVLEENDILNISGAPVRLHIYSRWKSDLVRPSQSLVVSLGAKAVRLGLSVDKQQFEPQCLGREVIEPRYK